MPRIKQGRKWGWEIGIYTVCPRREGGGGNGRRWGGGGNGGKKHREK